MNDLPATATSAAGPAGGGGETRIEVDLVRNTITVTVPDAVRNTFGGVGAAGTPVMGTLDIGVRGRLIGLEIGEHYVDICASEAGTAHLTRSVVVALTAHREHHGLVAVSFRRSGEDYEISFPSGNQCWEIGRPDSGSTVRVCSVLTG